MVDLTISGGTVITAYGTFKTGIVVDKGKIVGICQDSNLPNSDLRINCEGCLVLPGVIDEHSHNRDPGFEYKEDFRTGTSSAAAGGVTMVMEMPNTIPWIIDRKAFLDKKNYLKPKSLVDFALQVAVTPRNIGILGELKEEGAASFEIFPSEVPVDLLTDKDLDILNALKELAKINGLAAFLSESNDIRDRLVSELQAKGRKDLPAHLETRPAVSEASKAASLFTMASLTGTRIIMRQISAAESVEIASLFKPKNRNLFIETTPHYMLLTDDVMKEVGAIARMVPPLRYKKDVEAVREAVRSGLVDVIGTDHSPQTLEDKNKGTRSVWDAPPGFPGVETLVPLMLTEVNKGLISIEHLCRLISENPAKIYGLYPRKGSIQVGSDADFTIVDMKKESVIRGEKLHSKMKYTPFEGFSAKGLPIHTILRGELIVENGEVIGKPGYGEFVRCP